ncbi:Toxin co-regulated pilus biosynthesis protein Q [Pigmentiphaga humi]|uniref:Toxin co-regulated pilus biosynthesis protein Q n=1 Tax=Pigmentiphaga humi TaxID=2478468 RepID=A0A3P4B092_9BURK|nr:TcpQ domain-containing protein [Pigmentiphaga humi]VCU69078.1 Toxin co-regulated pilus biosynthesis protein Q [Pigmentiphaga humi]
MPSCRLLPIAALSACCLAHAQSPVAVPAGQGQGGYDFAYRVAGDKRVAPVQVFDDGRQTYMQFRAGQVPPAIFSSGPEGDRLAPVSWEGGYAVVAGMAREFALRIGEVTASVRYQGRTLRGASMGTARQSESWGGEPAGRADFPVMQTARLPPDPQPAAAMAARMPVRAAQVYEATPADRNMRQALRRWAGLAGWTFDTEHWAVHVDIPLAGSASLGSDFKSAVRELLAATELSAHPLQPCFYSNRVLRVIAYAESCDRRAAETARQG